MREIQVVNGEVIGRLFFGEKFLEYQIEGIPVSKFIADIFASIGIEAKSASFLLFGPKFWETGILAKQRDLQRRFKLYRSQVSEIIRKRMEEIAANKKAGKQPTGFKTMLDYFQEMREEGSEYALNDKEILDTIGSFFHAGVDNVGHTAAESTYCLIHEADDKFRELFR